MPTQNQHLQALYMSKAESLARWSYIGILLPLIGIIVGGLSLSTLHRIEPETPQERKEVRRIGRVAGVGVTISVILLLIGVFFIIALIDAAANVGNAVKNGSITKSLQDETTSQLASATIYKVGDTVPFATQTFKVNSVTVATSIRENNSYSKPTYAKDGTKFIVINVTVTNTTSTPFSFDDYILYDNKDRQYNAFNDIGDIDNYMAVRDLEPSIPETGVVVYQVPNDATEFRLGAIKDGTNKMLLVKFDAQ